MMRKVLLWRRVYVGMSPIVAVPVLRRRVGVSANVAGVCVCVAGGVAGGVCVVCIVS
jgi:hypothetical protein